MKTKIMITIEGGVVQHVSSNNPDVEYVIVDFDHDKGEEVSGWYEPDEVTDVFDEIIMPHIKDQLNNL